MPVIRSVESMNYLDIENSIIALGEKARTGSLAVEDMDGGTFTISNGGVFGSLFGTPIINPPQSAILGMHGIFDRPVARNGQVRFLATFLILNILNNSRLFQTFREGFNTKILNTLCGFKYYPEYFMKELIFPLIRK